MFQPLTKFFMSHFLPQAECILCIFMSQSFSRCSCQGIILILNSFLEVWTARETELITVSFQVDPHICKRKKKPVTHQEQVSLTQKMKKTNWRRIILIALSCASLFEDNPLFDCCCLITSSSTFEKQYFFNKQQVIQCSNPTKFR